MEKSKKGLNRDELNQKFERIKSNLNMLSNQGKERIVFENDDRMNELYTQKGIDSDSLDVFLRKHTDRTNERQQRSKQADNTIEITNEDFTLTKNSVLENSPIITRDREDLTFKVEQFESLMEKFAKDPQSTGN